MSTYEEPLDVRLKCFWIRKSVKTVLLFEMDDDTVFSVLLAEVEFVVGVLDPMVDGLTGKSCGNTDGESHGDVLFFEDELFGFDTLSKFLQKSIAGFLRVAFGKDQEFLAAPA